VDGGKWRELKTPPPSLFFSTILGEESSWNDASSRAEGKEGDPSGSLFHSLLLAQGTEGKKGREKRGPNLCIERKINPPQFLHRCPCWFREETRRKKEETEGEKGGRRKGGKKKKK